MELFPLFFIGGIFCLIIGGLVYSHFAEKKRREQLLEVAQGLGLTFSQAKIDPDTLSLGGLPMLESGRRRRCFNRMSGELGDVRVHLFDYKYTTGSGKNSSTHYRTVAAFELTQHRLPQFTLSPEHFFHSIAVAFGFDDIDFDDYPIFSKRYILKGNNEQAVREVFTPKVIEYFEAHLDEKWQVQAAGNRMLVCHAHKRMRPEQWPQLLEDAFGVMNVMTMNARPA